MGAKLKMRWCAVVVIVGLLFQRVEILNGSLVCNISLYHLKTIAVLSCLGAFCKRHCI